MYAAISRYVNEQVQIPYISHQIHDYIRDNINLDEISRWLSRDEWINLAKESLGRTWTLLSTSVSFLISAVSWLIVLLYLIFMMLDYVHRSAQHGALPSAHIAPYRCADVCGGIRLQRR